MKKTLFAVLALGLAASADAKKYEIDAGHSAVAFKIRHLGSKVPGTFNAFSGTLNYDAKDVSKWAADVKIETKSVDTNNDKRDAHLRTADFFDADKCPEITFKSTKATGTTKAAKLHGDLTMRCVTKPVVLDVELGEEMADPWGNQKLGASAKAKLNRKDFGISWNKALDKGGAILGDEVEITIDIEAAASKEEAKESAKQESKAVKGKDEKKKQ